MIGVINGKIIIYHSWKSTAGPCKNARDDIFISFSTDSMFKVFNNHPTTSDGASIFESDDIKEAIAFADSFIEEA